MKIKQLTIGALSLMLAINIAGVSSPALATSLESTVAPKSLLTTMGSTIEEGITLIPSPFSGDLTSVLTTVASTMLFLVGSLSVIMIIYGAIRYVLSAGDAKNVEAAKQTILYAIIGLIVAILGVSIINFVKDTLAGTSATATQSTPAPTYIKGNGKPIE